MAEQSEKLTLRANSAQQCGQRRIRVLQRCWEVQHSITLVSYLCRTAAQASRRDAVASRFERQPPACSHITAEMNERTGRQLQQQRYLPGWIRVIVQLQLPESILLALEKHNPHLPGQYMSRPDAAEALWLRNALRERGPENRNVGGGYSSPLIGTL